MVEKSCVPFSGTPPFSFRHGQALQRRKCLRNDAGRPGQASSIGPREDASQPATRSAGLFGPGRSRQIRLVSHADRVPVGRRPVGVVLTVRIGPLHGDRFLRRDGEVAGVAVAASRLIITIRVRYTFAMMFVLSPDDEFEPRRFIFASAAERVLPAYAREPAKIEVRGMNLGLILDRQRSDMGVGCERSAHADRSQAGQQ